MLLITSLKITPEEVDSLVAKMRKDRDNIRELFSAIVSIKEVDKAVLKIDALAGAFTDSLDKIPVHIVTLKLSMSTQYNDKCTKCILRLRKDLSREEKDIVFNVLEKEKEVIDKLQRKNMENKITLGFLTKFRITRFVKKFKERYAKRKEQQKQEEKEYAKIAKQALVLDDERRLDLEEEIANLKGNLDLAIKELKAPELIAKYKNKIDKLPYQKYFICFSEDILCWKTKSSSNKIEGRVYISNIENITVERDVYITIVGA